MRRPKPVTVPALVRRINRHLAEDGPERLRKTRGWIDRAAIGEWHVLDTSNGKVVCEETDPEEIGRMLGVLQKWESVAAT